MKPKGEAGSSVGSVLEGAFRRFLRRAPKQSRSRSLVSALLQAFDEQLARGSSLDGVTVESLSHRAGVGVGSFYEYFSSKDSLLGAFIGRVTRDNFDKLAAGLEQRNHATLDALIEDFALALASAYFDHPVRTRVVVDGVARLGLLEIVNQERDRFAQVMTKSVAKHLPDEDPVRLARTMQIVADGGMGLIVGCSARDRDPDIPAIAAELADLARGILRQRHPTSC
jgi:AcrR family transcriptional regulator